jgi:hypothetical protein
VNEFTEAARAGRSVSPAPLAGTAVAPAADAVLPSAIAMNQAPLRVRDPQALGASDLMEGVSADLPPIEADRPIVSRRRSKAVPILVAVTILLLLTNAGTLVYFYLLNREVGQTTQATITQVAADADARVANLLAGEAVRWQKEAGLVAEQANRAAKIVADKAKEKPDEAKQAAQEAEGYANRACAAANTIKEILDLMPKDVLSAPQPSGALTQAREAKTIADEAANAAKSDAGKAKAHFDPVSAPPEQAATVSKELEDIAAKARKALAEAGGFAKTAKAACEQAVKAKDEDAAKAALGRAKKAADDAAQAAQKVTDAFNTLQSQVEADSKNTALVKLAKEIGEAANTAAAAAEDANEDAKDASKAPVLQPKVAIGARATDSASKAQLVPSQRNGNVFEFKVPGADSFVDQPPSFASLKKAVLKPQAGGAVIRAETKGGSDIDFLTGRFDSDTGVLRCTLGEKAQQFRKDLVEWFVVEVKSSKSGDVYQCTLARPDPVVHIFKTGYDIAAKDGKITPLPPQSYTFAYPWADALSIWEKGAKDTPLTVAKPVTVTRRVGRDSKNQCVVNLTFQITPPANQDGAYQLAVETNAVAIIYKATQKARAELPKLADEEADKKTLCKEAEGDLKKANDTIRKHSAEFGEVPRPEEGQARGKYKDELAVRINKPQTEIDRLSQSLKQANDRIDEINKKYKDRKAPLERQLGKAKEPTKKGLEDQIAELDRQAANERKPHEEARGKANEALKQLTGERTRIIQMQEAIGAADFSAANLAKFQGELEKVKNKIAGHEAALRELMEDLTNAFAAGPVEIRDAWGLPVVTMKLVLQGCDTAKFLRSPVIAPLTRQ